MNGFIQFDYESVKGDVLEVDGEVRNDKVTFKCFRSGTNYKIPRSQLTSIDINNITDFILENCENEIDTISDFYDRQD